MATLAPSAPKAKGKKSSKAEKHALLTEVVTVDAKFDRQ
jgi:hypothetical protein